MAPTMVKSSFLYYNLTNHLPTTWQRAGEFCYWRLEKHHQYPVSWMRRRFSPIIPNFCLNLILENLCTFIICTCNWS